MTRENYIKYLQSMINDAEDMGLYDEDVESLQVAIKALEPKTGHWIHFASGDDCSECGWSTGKYISPSNYCPNCGAKMESEGPV